MGLKNAEGKSEEKILPQSAQRAPRIFILGFELKKYLTTDDIQLKMKNYMDKLKWISKWRPFAPWRGNIFNHEDREGTRRGRLPRFCFRKRRIINHG